LVVRIAIVFNSTTKPKFVVAIKTRKELLYVNWRVFFMSLFSSNVLWQPTYYAPC